MESAWCKVSKKEIRHCKGLENSPKFQCLSQIFINLNRTHSALLLFPLSPKYFLVENRLFMLQLTVYVHFWWTQMGAPACTGCSELGLIADCRQKTSLEADTSQIVKVGEPGSWTRASTHTWAPGPRHIVVRNSKSDWNPWIHLYLAPWLIFNLNMSMVSHIWVWIFKIHRVCIKSSTSGLL